jgi:hypothetical protein
VSGLRVELTFVCSSKKEAARLEEVLSPDNKTIPKDQTLSTQLRGRCLRYVISSPSRPTGCISSALGILGDAKLFQDLRTIAALPIVAATTTS